jgi:hypothetical protein
MAKRIETTLPDAEFAPYRSAFYDLDPVFDSPLELFRFPDLWPCDHDEMCWLQPMKSRPCP